MRLPFPHLLLSTTAGLLLTPSFALGQVFISTVTVTESGSSTTETVSFSKAEDALTLYDPDTLDARFPTYDDTTGSESGINSNLNYRGLPILVTMQENQTSLTFTIDRLGITQTFNGATRDESAEQFYDFLISDGGSLLSRIQQELARVSPVDPIAGNPNSMQSRVISSLGAAGGFSSGSGLVFSAPTPTSTPSTSEYIPLSQMERVTYLQSAGARGTQNSVNLSVSGGSFSAGDAEGTAFSLPTGYTLRLDSYPGLSFDLSVPISYSEVDESVTIGGIGALSFGVPLSDAWTIAPSISYGVVGSVDLGAAAQLAGAALTSTYAIPQGPGTVVVANMLGYVTTLPFDFGDISYDPGINNTVLKNGLAYELPVDFAIFGNSSSVQLAYAYTYLLGTELFMNDFHDVSASFGVAEGARGFASMVRLGVGATLGEDFTSYGLNFGYTF